MWKTIIWGNAFWAGPLILISFVGRENFQRLYKGKCRAVICTHFWGNWGAAEKKTWGDKETKNLKLVWTTGTDDSTTENDIIFPGKNTSGWPSF